MIAGRRVTFGAPFGSLARLRRGDRIKTVDGVGGPTYRVTRVFASPLASMVATQTTDNRITLISSDSSVVTSGRLVVVGKLVGTPYFLPSATGSPRDPS